jgi:erythromycin esterase
MTARPNAHPLAQHVSVLRGLTREGAGLGDLDVLGDLTQGARVVGIGEGAHFVHEFATARMHLVHFLVERCGFTHVALEIGRAQATQLEPWVRGDLAASELSAYAGPLTRGLYGPFLRWLRAYNAGRSSPVRLIGPDLPNTLTISSDLDVLDTYLREVDPPTLTVLAEAQHVAAKIEGGSAAVSAFAWAALDVGERERLSARLAQLALRLSALEPLFLERGGAAAFHHTMHHLEAARHADQMLRAMSDLFSGTGLPADTSIRDRFAATSLSAMLAREPADARVVVVAHNNHIQKKPVSFDGELAAIPMGCYLARELGERYRAVGLTHLGQRVPEMSFPEPESPVGFGVSLVEVSAPEPGSIEHALIEAGLHEVGTLVDMRGGARSLGLSRIRSQSASVTAPLHEAFDAIVAVPTASVEPELPF